MLLQLWVQMRDDFPGGFLVINYYNLRRGSEIIPLCFTSENIIPLSFIIPPITQHAQLLSQAQGRVRDRQARRDGEREMERERERERDKERSRERGGVGAGVFVREKRKEEFQEGHCFCVALPTSVYLITSETVQSLRQFE